MKKDHFPLPFIDQILDKLSSQRYYYFLDRYFGLQSDGDWWRIILKNMNTRVPSEPILLLAHEFEKLSIH